MRRLALLLVAAVAMVVVVAVALDKGDETGDRRPAAARLPDVRLQPLRADGKAVDLGQLKGPAVLNVWAQWCGPCKAELPKIQAFHRAHPQVDVLGVDWMDTQPERALALADKSGLTYPLVTDPDRHIPGRGLPQLILLDAKGRIAYREFVEIKTTAQLESLVRKHLGVDL